MSLLDFCFCFRFPCAVRTIRLVFLRLKTDTEVDMLKNFALGVVACAVLGACGSSSGPRIIQSVSGNPEIVVTVGMATQVEMPEQERVASIAVGNSELVTAEKDGDVITLSANKESGETNLIVRARDDSGKTKVYQYHVVVKTP